ncbi:MAG: hypothetical protein ACRCW9_06065 [Cetobacterium sp.]
MLKVKQYEIILVSKPVIQLLEELLMEDEHSLKYSESIEKYAKILVLYDYLPCNDLMDCKIKSFKYNNQYFHLRKDKQGNIMFFKATETPKKFNEIRLGVD